MVNYRSLLDKVCAKHCLAESPRKALPSELELQALWFSGAFGRDFVNTESKAVRIIQFGEWNRMAGPDFTHAVVEVDGVVSHGPIELDIDPNDWETHGHGADLSFIDTVLHVVLVDRPTCFTRNANHKQVTQVVIPSDRVDCALALPTRQVAIARVGRCVQPLKNIGNQPLAKILRQSAEHRASVKAARFLRVAAVHGRDAALYQATAETLGYRANALPMRLLAQRLPLAAIRAEQVDPHALLAGAAGFLAADLHESAPADTQAHLRDLWECWWKHRDRWDSSHALPWKMHGQRPANHPHRRVAALALLASRWPTYRKLALARPFQPKPLIKFLAELNDHFWSHRHTLSSIHSPRSIALFGKSRALELLANHLVPLALHEDQSFTYESYLKLGVTGTNEKVRRCAIRLFGSEKAAAPWLRTTAHQQAMLQIYHDFCLEDVSDCSACPFPEQLSQWG